MQLPSSLLENAVAEFSKLPGIGKKTALRLVLHLLKQEASSTNQFCKNCFNISDGPICSICSNTSRSKETICVVENIRDVIAIENTSQYHGTYHVLGGIISPLDGIGPEQLTIEPLMERIQKNGVTELIFALNPTIQGDTTIYYIQKKMTGNACKVTTIARGIAFGGELEYADEMTLGKSISNRQPIQQYIK
jgi:recombination protein RecR